MNLKPFVIPCIILLILSVLLVISQSIPHAVIGIIEYTDGTHPTNLTIVIFNKAGTENVTYPGDGNYYPASGYFNIGIGNSPIYQVGSEINITCSDGISTTSKLINISSTASTDIGTIQLDPPIPKVIERFNVTWTETYAGLTHHEYIVEIQNLNSTDNLDFDLSLIINSTSFDIAGIKNMNMHEWKAIDIDIPTYKSRNVSNYYVYPNMTSSFTYPPNCWNNTHNTTHYPCNVTETYQNGTITKKKCNWKPAKSKLVHKPSQIKAGYGNITIPKYSSERKVDDYNVTETVDGIKRFKVTFDMPFIQREDKTWGSSGMIGFIDDLSGKLYHPWWNSSYEYKREIDCTSMADSVPIVINSSEGFDLGGGKNIVWTYCSGTGTALYYNNYTDYVVANDTTQLPMEIELGNGTNYLATSVWSNVATYHLDELNPLDSSGNGWDGTDSGTPTIVPGKFSSGYYMNAATEYYGIGDYDLAADWTLMWWINATNTGTWQRVVFKNFAISGYVGDDTLFWYNSTGVGWGSGHQSAVDYTQDVWFQIAISYDSTHAHVYRNGAFQTSFALTQGMNNNAFVVGNLESDPSNMIFDEFRIYSRTLLVGEINQTYQNALGTVGFGTLGAEETSNVDPIITLNSPADNSTGITISPILNCTVTDEDLDSMNVTFYNAASNTAICTNLSIANGSNVHCTWASLNHSTTYAWYANVTDGIANVQSHTWNFTTSVDTIPPACPTNIQAYRVGTTWLEWNWTEPVDHNGDYSHTEVWFSEQNDALEWKENDTNNKYSIDFLYDGSTYVLYLVPVDIYENKNTTCINNTQVTLSAGLTTAQNATLYKIWEAIQEVNKTTRETNGTTHSILSNQTAILTKIIDTFNYVSNGSLTTAIWTYATREITGGNLTTPNDYKADISGLATQANLTALEVQGNNTWATATGFETETEAASRYANITANQTSIINTLNNMNETIKDTHSYVADIYTATSITGVLLADDSVTEAAMESSGLYEIAYNVWSDYTPRTLTNYSGVWSVATRELTGVDFNLYSNWPTLQGYVWNASTRNLTDYNHTSLIDGIWDEPLTGATHNSPTSAGRRLREVSGYVLHTGTAQAGNGYSITFEASASPTDHIYNRNLIVLVDGVGAGQTRTIVDYDGTTKVAVIDREWYISPDSTSEYFVVADDTPLVADHGIAQGGTNDSITLRSTASSIDDTYRGSIVNIMASTGKGEARIIESYNGTTKVATVTPCWVTSPDNTSIYVVMPYGQSIVCTFCDEALILMTDEIWNHSTRDLTDYNQTRILTYLDTINDTTIGAANLTASDVWTYSNRTLTDYNLTLSNNYLDTINVTVGWIERTCCC